MSAPLNPCIHCKKRKAEYGRRGLCKPCYKNSLIRMGYPKKDQAEDNSTEEELDRMIAERRPTMPRKTIEDMLEDGEEVLREPYRIPIIRIVFKHNNTIEYRIT